MQSEKIPMDGELGNSGLKAKITSRFKKRSEESPEKKKQLQDYTAWVNNYLRRKPGTPLISDLRWSLGDGITFVHLVEIVAKVQVNGIERWPSTLERQRLNTERALEFLRDDCVVLHQDACRDLLEGNVKGVMKVILALAERYQPKSVKPRQDPGRPDSGRPSNHTAPVTTTDTHYTQQDIHPYTHPQSTTTRMEHSHSLSQPSFHSSQYPGPYTQDAIAEEVYSSPIDQLPANKPPQVISSKKKMAAGARSRTVSGDTYGGSIQEETLVEWEGSSGQNIGGDINTVMNGLIDFKTELLQLHAILLRNNDGVRDVGGANVGVATVGGANVEGPAMSGEEKSEDREKEMMVEIRSLREGIKHMQDECTQVEAECSTLRNMVEERNAFITTIKSEIYRKEYLNDTQKTELHTQLLHKDTHIKKLEADLASCHSNLETRETELNTLRDELEQRQETVERNRVELEKLQNELGRITTSEEKMTQRLSAKEKKLISSEEKLTEEKEKNARRIQQLSEDLETLSEGLTGITADSAQSEELEGLIKLVSVMSSHSLPSSSPARRRRHEDYPRHRRKKRSNDRQTIEQPHPQQTTPTTTNDITRVLYHMAGDSKNDIPSVAIVHKKASEVTLKDFKDVFGRHGNYRFFFKTEDPDCGVVKEEMIADDQILPNFKGKVTAWIREGDTSIAMTT